MSKSFKTEGVVLRGIRFGEADRILHIYSEMHGTISCIAKGVRRTRSRFGGRLEPFFRLQLVLYRGRGELYTVTQAQTVASYPKLRSDMHALEAADWGSQAVLRLLPEAEQNRPAYNLLCRYMDMVDKASGRRDRANWVTMALAFRIKLLLTAGFAPELYRCVICGGDDNPKGFSAASGGTVCFECLSNGQRMDARALEFMRDALSSPMSQVKSGEQGVLREVDRAVRELAEYHAHTRLMRVA